MFIENKYYKWYQNLTSNKIEKEGYTEKHHIIPKCMGGSNDKDNLVKLTAREHFIAHLLLTKITTGKNKKKMMFALWNMVNRNNGKYVSSKQYSELREAHSLFLSNELCGENNPMFGKTHSDETKLKISINSKGLKRSDETKLKISLANSGIKNSMYGKTHSEEQKKAQSEMMKKSNPMFNEDTVNKIKISKIGTINCFDTLTLTFVRISRDEYFQNKDRYKNNNSKEAKLFKDQV